MSDKLPELIFKEEYHDKRYTTLCVDGLSVDEMNQILNVSHDSLGEIMKNHGHGQMYMEWKYGWGIYGIRHVGGHLFVMVGNNCD